MTIDMDDTARTADEYVLGLLEPEDNRAVEAALEENEELKTAVAASRERFLALDLAVDEASFSDGLWDRIETELPEYRKMHVGIDIAPPPVPSNDNRASIWRRTAVASIAASLILAAGLGWSLMRNVDPIVVAILLNDAGEPQAIVEDFNNEEASIRLLADFAVPEGKTLQVWTLPNREMGPVSLGLLDERRSARLRTPALPEPKDAQLYEITLEQTGGSPTGRPTGPILVKGFAKIPL